MKTLFKRNTILLLVFICTLPTLLTAKAVRRPYYAQYGMEATFNSLGIAAGVVPYDLASIHYLPSNLISLNKNMMEVNYGYHDGNDVSIDYANIVSDKLVLGFGGQFNLPSRSELDTEHFPTEGVFNFGMAYDLGSSGTIGSNIKVPFDSYLSGAPEGGFLLGVDYHIPLFGFNFNVGLENIGFMYSGDYHFAGIYPDIQLGASYVLEGDDNQKIVSLSFVLENNIGAFISQSKIIGLGLSARIFSTGMFNEKAMINDPGISSRDKPVLLQAKDNDAFTANLYFNVGFQISDESHFSVGLSSLVQDYLFDLALIFPSEESRVFSVYVSVAKKF